MVLAMLVGCCLSAEAKGMTIDGSQRIKTTAYYLDGITASGQHVRPGICAGMDWMVDEADENGSWTAMIWTADGTEFLGYFELLDKGGTDAIKNGNVIDVWFPTYEECQEWMEITNGKCLVRYFYAVG